MLLRKTLFMMEMLKIRLLNKQPFPLYVNLVINRACNLRCLYCFGEYYNKREREYTLQEIKGIVDKLYTMGTRYILLQGGEPFLRRDLGEIIDYSTGKGIITAIVTNGTLPHRIKAVPELRKLDYICFSLDGFKEDNDPQRGSGVFDKVLLSMEEVWRCHPGLKIRVNCVLTKYTIDSFPAFLAFCETRGVDVQVGYLFKHNPIAAPVEKIKAMSDFIYGEKRRGARVIASRSTWRYVRDWPFEDEIWVTRERALAALGKQAKQCQYGRYEIVIDSDGNVYPCNALQGDPAFQPKNVREVEVEEAVRHLQTKPCYTCNIPAMLDTSQIINWDLPTIIERIRMELRARVVQ